VLGDKAQIAVLAVAVESARKLERRRSAVCGRHPRL
jgi:hypothetical protein